MPLQQAARNVLERILAGGTAEQVSGIPAPEQFERQPEPIPAPEETPEQAWQRLSGLAGVRAPLRTLPEAEAPIETPPPPPPPPPSPPREITMGAVPEGVKYKKPKEDELYWLSSEDREALKEEIGLLKSEKIGRDILMWWLAPTVIPGATPIRAVLASNLAKQGFPKLASVITRGGLLPIEFIEQIPVKASKFAARKIARLAGSEFVRGQVGGVKFPSRETWLKTAEGQEYQKLLSIPLKSPKEGARFKTLTEKFNELGMSPKEIKAWRAEGRRLQAIDEATEQAIEQADEVAMEATAKEIAQLAGTKFVTSEVGGIKLLSSKVARRVARKIGQTSEDTVDETLQTKIKGAFDYALKSQKETAQLYKGQRATKAGKMLEAYKAEEGTESYFKALGALKGTLEKGEFTMPTEFQFAKADADLLLNKLYKLSPTLDSYEIHNTGTAIMKLSGLLTDEVGNPMPLQKAELELLQVVFPELRPIAESYKSLGAKAWGYFVDILNLPRSILATGDLSFTFRQGAMALARKPQHLPGTIKTQLQVLFSPKNYENINKALLDDPAIQNFVRNKMYWAPEPGKPIGRLWAREEQFMSNLAERIPIIGKFVKASERAFQGGANYLRGQMAKDYTKMLEKAGVLTDENVEGLAKVINAATGRGDLPSSLRNAAPVVNAIFFSPRYLLSRLQLPGLMFSSNSVVRKEAVRTFVQFMGAGASVLGIASLAGAKIEMNPLSSDFGKLRIGNTRLDVWTGYAQWARMLAQLIMNQRITTTTGEMQELNRYETLIRFMQSKQSPLASLFTDLLAGETYIGEPMFEGGWETLGREAKNRLVSLFLQDTIDALNVDGFPGGLAALPGAFGVGVVTYKPKTKIGVAANRAEEALKRYKQSQGKTGSGSRAEEALKRARQRGF